MTRGLELAPNHFVDNANVRLDDANDLRGDVFVHVVGNRDARQAVADEGDGYVYALQEALGVDAGKHEAALVEGFGTLGRCPNADGREGMADRSEKATLLRQSATIRHHRESIHLKAIIVMETQRLVLNHTGIQLKARSLQAFAGTRMARIKDGHIILLCQLVNRIEQAQEVFLRIDILLTMGAQKNVLPFLQSQPCMNVASLNICQIIVQHLSHR